MEWSDEDVGRAWQEWRSTPTRDMDDALRRVMSLAVELVATRGCGAIELPDGFEDVLREMESRGSKREAQAAVTVRGLLASHAAQRAQVATLQAKVEGLDHDLAFWKGQQDGGTAILHRVQHANVELRAEVERLKKESRRAMEEEARVRIDLRRRADLAESRLAAIREKGAAYRKAVDEYLHAKRRDWDTAPFMEAVRATAEALDDVLEGDAPQEAKDAPLDPAEGRCAAPVSPSNRPCYLPPGHTGECKARPAKCSRSLGSGSIRLLCQLPPNHEGPCKASL
jgi:hypothetical protein